jgi:hypothetical protein
MYSVRHTHNLDGNGRFGILRRNQRKRLKMRKKQKWLQEVEKKKRKKRRWAEKGVGWM